VLKVLGIAGSPRRGGNSEILLDRALVGARDAGGDTEKLVLNRLKLRACQHCGGCTSTGVCVVQDDMQDVLVRLREADVIILASPIYFMSISAQTKIMIDRCQALWVEKYVLKKPRPKRRGQRRGLFISVAGLEREDVFAGAIPVVKAFFATVDVTYTGNLLYRGIDKKGEIRQRSDALQEAYEAGQRLVHETKEAQRQLS